MGQEVIVENIQPLWFLNELGKLHIITLKNYISEVSGRIDAWFLEKKMQSVNNFVIIFEVITLRNTMQKTLYRRGEAFVLFD